MDRQNGKKGYHAMKEQKLDDLERMFRDGLQDLKAEPDAAVWTAIQDATKKRRRFWLFWSFVGMVAIGLVATVLLLNDAQVETLEKVGHGDVETRGHGDEETRGRGDEEMRGLRDEGNAIVRHTERSRSTTDLPESTVNGQQSTVNGNEPRAQSLQPIAQVTVQYAEHPTQRWEIRDVTVPPFQFGFDNEETIPFSLDHVSNYNPKPPVKDTIKTPSPLKMTSPWSVAFNPAILVPRIHSFGQEGDVNYAKTNKPGMGISFGLNLNYLWKEHWILRTGVDWSSYMLSGDHSYYGLTDTVEWIDRERNTGYQVVSKSRSWAFESRYQWIAIPLEVGRRQIIGKKLSWEWTLGAGVNYLYRYDKIAEANPYLAGIDEGIQRLQLNVRAGFGVNYQLSGPWSTFVNVRYLYQPNNVYKSQLLKENHQMTGFGIGLKYQFKRKGN